MLGGWLSWVVLLAVGSVVWFAVSEVWLCGATKAVSMVV